MTSQRDIVRAALERDNQKDVTPRRPPGDRRQHHRAGDVLDADASSTTCIYCGLQMTELARQLRMACPVLLGDPLPTHAVRVGSERQGWRARLANVERLLDESLGESRLQRVGAPRREQVSEALTEIRSMLDLQ